jgi:hypothetical protein
MRNIVRQTFLLAHASILIIASLIAYPSAAQLNAKYLTQYTELDGLPGVRVSNIVTDWQGFQPFFTTKPTDQGKGLGLSLAYDIVKAHGGELKVETKEGEGSEFIIQIPTD